MNRGITNNLSSSSYKKIRTSSFRERLFFSFFCKFLLENMPNSIQDYVIIGHRHLKF